MTVTSDLACNSPADSSVWSSSTNNPSIITFNLRILRSMESSQCFFSCSIAFNSWMVFVGMTWTVTTLPSKVFTFSLLAMAKKTVSEKNLRCLEVQNFPYNFQQIWRSITKFILQTSGHPNNKDPVVRMSRHAKKMAARPERKIKKDVFFSGEARKHFSFTKAYKLWFLFCLVGAVAMTCPSFVLAVFACGGASFLRKFSGQQL